MKRMILTLSLAALISSLSACGTTQAPNQAASALASNAGGTSASQQFLALSAEQQAQVAAQLQRGAGMGGPGGMGGMGGLRPGGGMSGPGGLPPNIEEIRAKYPELATALEAMQSLSPEERRAKMDVLFTEHPEWREALMPPGGMRPGGFGPPPSGAPAPVASPAA